MSTSIWKNVIARLGNAAKTSELAQQVRERMENPIRHINQRSQNLCGTAAYVFIMALVMPEEYSMLVHVLWCQGGYKPFTVDIQAKSGWEEMMREIHGNKNKLIYMTDLNPKEITSLDWMVMTALRNSQPDRRWWESASSKDCQGTCVKHDKVYMKMLFNADNTLIFNYVGEPNPLPEEMWNDVMAAAGKDYTLLPLGIYVGKQSAVKDFTNRKERGHPNHVVVLVTTQHNIFHETDDCIIWTWAKLFTLPCEDLQSITVEAFQLDFEMLVNTGKIPTNGSSSFIVHLERIKDLKVNAKRNIKRLTSLKNVRGEEFA